MVWAHGRQVPDANLMRFVSRRFSSGPVTFLDIGSGEGSNARELRIRGHDVITIDRNPTVLANYNEDISKWDGNGLSYECIYDINTLCHVEDPPFEKIKGWLKPDGIFFSICPTAGTWHGVAEGKKFTRFATLGNLRDMFNDFSYQIYEASCPDFQGNYLESWIVEASKTE